MRIETVDELRRAAALGRSPREFAVESIDLCAAVELAAWKAATGLRESAVIAERFAGWCAKHNVLRRACSAFSGGLDAVGIYAAPGDEIRSIPTRAEFVDGLDWAAFRQRFERSLKERGGFERRLALALTGALSEMVDNVIQHSSVNVDEPIRGAVGYAVTTGQMRFAVADIGCGVLASLQRNPTHALLATSAEALRAAVLEQATSRRSEVAGDGFGQVLRSLAGLGSVRFRSGNSLLTLEDARDVRNHRIASSAPLGGLQLVVQCRAVE